MQSPHGDQPPKPACTPILNLSPSRGHPSSPTYPPSSSPTPFSSPPLVRPSQGQSDSERLNTQMSFRAPKCVILSEAEESKPFIHNPRHPRPTPRHPRPRSGTSATCAESAPRRRTPSQTPDPSALLTVTGKGPQSRPFSFRALTHVTLTSHTCHARAPKCHSERSRRIYAPLTETPTPHPPSSLPVTPHHYPHPRGISSTYPPRARPSTPTKTPCPQPTKT